MKILMVCLGNICRSPLAEGILRKKAEENNLEIEVDSAGTANYHVDHLPDTRSISKGMEYGIDISMLRGRQFQYSDYNDFDRIYVMDTENLKNILILAKTDSDRKKADLILNLSQPTANMSVPDPYYGGEEGFENVYQLLDASCDVLIKELRNEHS